MNRPVQSPFNPENFLRHTRKVKAINKETEEVISDKVAHSLNRYLENWDEAFERESSRLKRIIDGLNTALAAILAKKWTFPDSDSMPFHDEASAFGWLSAKGAIPPYIGGHEDFILGDPDLLLEFERDWHTHNLWEVRKDFEQQHRDLLEFHASRAKDHPSRQPTSAARLPADIQELIHDLCQIWHDHVDSQLRLPRKDPQPNNPLLRFIDECLTIALGNQRPAKKTLLDFILKRSRHAIRRRDAVFEQRMRQLKLNPED
ncbi:MAG: hypothetical protein AAAB35_00430 [Phyllobacterium sp.]|uniref:hypothetical protein n=1 Tax=Phyllobacterium sp. TaxID=1871046 RepID=UPI0030F1B91F